MQPTACQASNVPDVTLIEVDQSIQGTNVDGPTVPEGECGTTFDNGSNVSWYRAIGTGNTLTASTCSDANFDTKIVVYCNCNQYSDYCVGGNDDSEGCSNFTSVVSWHSIIGQEYLLMVVGYEGQTGSFTLTLRDDGIPADASLRQCSGSNIVLTIKDDGSKYDKLPSPDKASGGSNGKGDISGKK